VGPVTATAAFAPTTRKLRAVLGDGLIDDPAIVAGYAGDRATFLTPGRAAAVALPSSTDEVAAVLRICSAAGVPVVPRGAGSGLAGGANAVDGCVVLCMARMDRILEIDAANLLAVVQPAVINAGLKAAVAGHGLVYPPDPSSFEFCSIGGNIATNAGGLCCVRYGVTRDYVLGLEVVLSDGTVIRTGRRTVKGVAGYDLTALFVGSEGTLGVVTEATLRLRPKPPPAATLVAFFPTLDRVGDAVVSIRRVMSPSMLEVMDRRTVAAVEDWKHLGLDATAAAMLVAQSDSGGDALADAERMTERCLAAGASSAYCSGDEAEAAMLVQARRLAIPAIERRGSWLLDDVGVPCTRIAELLRRVEDIAVARDIDIFSFGHAGDGNMHPTMSYDAGDLAARRRAELALDDIVVAALDLGGTVTGEHGVGSLKRRRLERELGTDNLALQRRLRATLDPAGILNPGKAIC
jgi:glycolate oxidase